MAYELHIERDEPIPMNEWKAVLSGLDGAVLRREDYVAANPKSGEEIRIPVRDGDAEVRIPDSARTIMLSWFEGHASFRLPDDWDDPNSAVRSTIFSLAKQLGARVVNDEGEECTSPANKPWWRFW